MILIHKKQFNKMATNKSNVKINTFKVKSKKNNKGIHSKKKNSSNKLSKNYVKQYKGQGR